MALVQALGHVVVKVRDPPLAGWAMAAVAIRAADAASEANRDLAGVIISLL